MLHNGLLTKRHVPPSEGKSCTYIQGSPSGCGRREIPGVSQVEKYSAGKQGHVVPIVAEKSAGVIYCEKAREVVSRNTYGSLGISEAWSYCITQRKS